MNENDKDFVNSYQNIKQKGVLRRNESKSEPENERILMKGKTWRVKLVEYV